MKSKMSKNMSAYEEVFLPNNEADDPNYMDKMVQQDELKFK